MAQIAALRQLFDQIPQNERLSALHKLQKDFAKAQRRSIPLGATIRFTAKTGERITAIVVKMNQKTFSAIETGSGRKWKIGIACDDIQVLAAVPAAPPVAVAPLVAEPKGRSSVKDRDAREGVEKRRRKMDQEQDSHRETKKDEERKKQ
jgi:hypothetical protein